MQEMLFLHTRIVTILYCEEFQSKIILNLESTCGSLEKKQALKSKELCVDFHSNILLWSTDLEKGIKPF